MNIGIIGIGRMGRAFVERFLSQGYTVRVFNRSPEKIKDLEKNGVTLCASVDELISSCSTIILMVSNAMAIHDLLSFDHKVGSEHRLKDKTFLQMATISPQQSIDLSNTLSTYNAQYLEAPVLGSIPEANSGTLIIMGGGSQPLFESSLPILQVLGSSPRYIGPTGSAAALKLSMNQLIAALTSGFCLSLGYALQNGVDVELFMDTLRDSALYAKTYDKKLDKYLTRDFGKANFSTQHLLKDVRLFINDAQAGNLNTASLEGIEKIIHQTVDDGYDLMDYSSIFQTVYPDT